MKTDDLQDRLDVSLSPLQSCWPTAEQELLLRAVLWQGEASLAAWREWKAAIDIENLDEGSTRLLPLLNHNLKRQNVSDPLMARFSSVHRYFWYRNQLLFNRGAALLRRLHAENITTMILKGAPLILQYYKDMGLRPMNDFDILVPPGQARRAFNLLCEWGWDPMLAPHQDFNGDFLKFIHAHAFQKESELSLDLHRHLLGRCCFDEADEDFWKGATTIEVQGVSTHALNATDQLMHVCLHGIQWQSVSPLRWIIDAMMVLRTSEAEAQKTRPITHLMVDWERLHNHAARWRLNLPLADGMKYLREHMQAPVPASVVESLSRLPATRSERVEYEASLRPPHSLGPAFKLWLRYRAFLRWEQSVGWKAALFSFPNYLQHTWELEDLKQVPMEAFHKSRRQLQQRRNWRQVAAAEGHQTTGSKRQQAGNN